MTLGRRLARAPFLCLLLWAPTLFACPLDGPAESVAVATVIDGDTVHLRDGRAVRFIGIDTPEIGREGRPSQPYAAAARAALRRRMAASGHTLLLRFGRQRRDHYGRLLAHPYTTDGTNLTAALLEEGLGTALAIPPNLENLSCYQRSEAKARAAARGVWSLPDYAVRPAAALPADHRGYTRLRGRVQRIGRGGGAVWLDLAGGPAIRIPDDALALFPEDFLQGLEGRTVTAEGWVYRRNQELRLTLRHPVDLQLEHD